MTVSVLINLKQKRNDMGRKTKYYTQEQRKAARREQRKERSLEPGYVAIQYYCHIEISRSFLKGKGRSSKGKPQGVRKA
jgi:hypothetical protein